MPPHATCANAGYQLEAIRNRRSEIFEDTDDNPLLKQLCTFSVEATCSLEPIPAADPLLAVAQNIVSRGYPTRPPCLVEERIADALGITAFDDSEKAEKTGQYRYVPTEQFHDETFRDALRRAHVVVEPRTNPDARQWAYESWEDHDSRAEHRFHLEAFPDLVGAAGAQLLEPQRSIRSLLRQTERDREKLESTLETAEEKVGGTLTDSFYEQRVDFSLAIPGESRGDRQGHVIEIDGAQHNETPQAVLDKKREQACAKAGWKTLRISTEDLRAGLTGQQKSILQSCMNHPWAKHAQKNMEAPLYDTEEGRQALQAALTPLAVARIHYVFLQLLRAGTLSLDDAKWSVAVIERDVPCARLALESLRDLLGALWSLRGGSEPLPEIDLRVYGTSEFEGCALRDPEKTFRLGEDASAFEADLLLDISMLQRKGWTYPTQREPEEVEADHDARLRSAHSARNERQVATGSPVKYDVGGTYDGEYEGEYEQPPPLRRLLRDLFRKRTFREGQVEILRRALRRKSAIALLPTGAGKSLTYQMAALLQPGVTLVVDPIKSLMRDQSLNLSEEGITATTYINSSLSTKKKGRHLDRMGEGEYLIVFVSPERLMIPRFRKRLQKMADQGLWFTHCVIDEAHCVSEWGHDFRTTYLRLGRNARRFLETGDEDDIPLFALTGTASYDVLEDVRRELGLDSMDEEGTVTPDSFRREELNFRVREVDVMVDEGAEGAARDLSFFLRKQVGQAKRKALAEAIDNLPKLFGDTEPDSFYRTDGEATNGGIVFAPHRTWLFGAKDIEGFLRRERDYLQGRTGYYHGATEEMGTSGEKELEKVQDAFKRNDLSLLVATKAFGMGIDKSNVRFTVHVNMPQSIESFYQEAGRAGRDRDDAYCIVLHSPAPTVPEIGAEDMKVSVDKDLMLSFHRNSFQGREHEMRMLDDVITTEVKLGDERAQSAIESKLEQMSTGATEEVYIRFQNDHAERLAAHLQEKTGAPWSRGMIDEARSYTHGYGAFIDNLESEAEKRNWPKAHPGSVAQLQTMRKNEQAIELFRTIRSQEDTFRAVHRLSLVGAIEDFRFHYGHNLVEATLCKRSGAAYIQHLQDYLQRYMAPERVADVEAEVRAKEDATLLRKSLRRLVDFVYERIKSKRRTAIDNMERALEDGSLDEESFQWKPEGKSEAQERFEERVYSFFESRYLPDLRPHLRDSYNADLLWAYIEETEGAEVKLRHLRGACDRLLEDNPDHAAFRLLRAYAEVLLPDGQLQRAQEDLKRAWDRLTEVEDRLSVLEIINRFLRETRELDAAAEERLADIALPIHTDWLDEFLSEELAEVA